jgi:dihydrofolate synthase/folylpolyglutamate synthase
MDHADYLGDTLELIAREKAGIVKRGVPFVTGESDPALVAIFEDVAASAGAPFHQVRPDDLRDVRVEPTRTSFVMVTATWGEIEIATPLVGAHQAANAAVAVAMLDRLHDDLRPSAREVRGGAWHVRHAGRNEVRVLDGLTWLFDVAHNPAGILAFADTLDRLELPRPRIALVGVLGDKDWRSMLPPLLERVDGMVLAVPPSAPADRRWDPWAVAAGLDAGGKPLIVAEDFGEAVAEAARRAGRGTVMVTGSVHTVGGGMRVLGIDPLNG